MMKKFLTSFVLFLVFALLVLHIKPLYLLYHNKYQKIVAGAETYVSLQKSKQKSKAKKLLLGDSVGQQLFPNHSNAFPINSLACNSGVSLVGQFILLNNYLQAGNRPDSVFLLYRPFSFKNNLNQEYTYHYFIKPFFTDEYMPYYSETVKTQVAKFPFMYLSRTPYFLTSNWAPSDFPLDKIDYTLFSPLSIEYLVKIKELSKNYHFHLSIIPAPISNRYKDAVGKMDQTEISKNNFSQDFANYFEDILFLPDSLFIDGMHLKKPEKFKEEMITKYMK